MAGHPQSQLQTLWDEAQESGGVLAVEPGATVLGHPAAVKKTWAVADQFLRYFVYGNQPNWFPGDIVRRTVCGSAPRWSYFWHGLSGSERDLHPWLGGEDGFSGLLGSHAVALLAGEAVSLAPCEEVGKADASSEDRTAKGCLYGEVTPPGGFDDWFCGGPEKTCRSFFKTTKNEQAPPDLMAARAFCMHGPFVLERVHEWRPEIHPAEVMWVRKNEERPFWTFVLVPDQSDRFDDEKHFETDAPGSDASWEPWSRQRPVELWVAFAAEPDRPVIFDLAAKAFQENADPASQVALTPPPPGGEFVRLPHSLEGVFAAARVWTGDLGEHRGFVVLRTTLRATREEALVLRLRGRGHEEDPWPAEIAAVQPRELTSGLEALPAPERARVRLFGLATVGESAVDGAAAINTLVRFDPGRPAVPEDEEAIGKLNEALGGRASERRNAFGSERPFRIEWTISATRDGGGGAFPVVLSGAGSMAGSASRSEVRVARFRGPATEEIVINEAPPPALEAAEEVSLVSLGQLLLSAPKGVTVSGIGRVFVSIAGGEPTVYAGHSPATDGQPALTVRFRHPQRSYQKGWDLVEDVLREIHAADAAAASQRLKSLQENACVLAESVDCEGLFLSAQAERNLADPIARWDTLRALEKGDRPFARFVWMFERGLRWDGSVTEDERDRMKELLTPGHDTSPGD